MSAAEALATLLESAAAASAATLLALALRRPLRRAFGAEVAYAAWALVPLAAWAVLLPTAAAPLPSAAASLRFGAVPAVPESGTAPALCAV
ncbi:M56 family metallopeptidase [Vulcaniibacterium tengchongense]|uniref:BlaR1 peptidase M56 n=1 Tax=Vulcaniibacterium tengchongense TaxID=1273429 RepID=A0A3N4VCD6_9GAMM|nr:M56 family metallopeptidase [Vulcaniibacterium tengchongense]RPE74807.1 BlaR1 peptidase M56 [Vulcaniibacterium tengchongense]